MGKEFIRKTVSKFVRNSFEYRSLGEYIKERGIEDEINEIIKREIESYHFEYDEYYHIIGPTPCCYEIARKVIDEFIKRLATLYKNTSIPGFW